MHGFTFSKNTTCAETKTATLDNKNQPTNLNQDLIALFERINHIANMTSLDELLSQMLDLMIEVSGGNAGTVYLLDQPTNELIFRVVKGNESSQKLVGNSIPANQGIVGSVVQYGNPIIIDDLGSDPRWYRTINGDTDNQLQSAVTLPLLAQGDVIGAVQIFNYQFAQIELLQLLGNRIASEVSKVLLLEKANAYNQKLQKLVGIMGDMVADLDREHLLNAVTENATQLLDAEHSLVYMVDPQNVDELQLVNDHTSLPTPVFGNTNPLLAAISSPMNSPQIDFDGGFVANSTVAVPLKTSPILINNGQNRDDKKTSGIVMALNKRNGQFDAEDTRLLEILTNHTSAVLQVADLYNDSNALFLDVIKALVAAIDAKDPYTQGHSQRVSEYSVVIAEELGLSTHEVQKIRIGSLLHDIGKIGVPDHILRKPGKLTDEEYDQIKQHAVIGKNIIGQVAMLQDIIPAISEHHERLDGSGYPLGIKDDQLSLLGRIVGVADVFDAMVSDRPYRSAIPLETVLEYLIENSDKLFDRDCVDALIRVIEKGKVQIN